MTDHTKQAEYFIVSGSVPGLANYLEKITGEAAEIIKEFKQERDEARAALAEIDRALKEFYTPAYSDHGAHIAVSCAKMLDEQAAQLKRERDELAAALRAFAALDISPLSNKPDDYPVFGMNDSKIAVGDVRAARAALAKLDNPAA